MSEVNIINDDEKINKSKKEKNFLSRKDFNSLSKNVPSKIDKNLDLNDSNINMNITSLENKENIDNNIMAYTTVKKNNEKKFNIKTNTVLQEKLKKIFLCREKRKYEYNKQDLPENLKYHSDSTNSDLEKKEKEKENTQNKKISVIKRQKSSVLNINQTSKENNNEINNKQKLKEKKTKSFNQKIIDNYLNDINKEKNEKKNTALKDIIEKLKAKKIEKDELFKKEKEQRIKEISKKIDERKNEREKLKEEKNINNKNKNIIPNRDRKKHTKKNNNNITNKINTKNESLLLPHKTYRDENDDEINSFNFINKSRRNNSISRQEKQNILKSQNDTNINTIYNKRKLNSIDVTYQQLYQNKNNITNIDINNNNNTINITNKKQENVNNTINIYKPKKPTLTKVGSRLKINLPSNPILNKLQIQSNFFNNRSTKNIFAPRGKNLGKIPYTKKPQINLYNMNNSVYDINNESGNNNNNISCLDINNVNNLNSSFDYYNNNMNMNMNNILTGRITHSSFLQNQNGNVLDKYTRNNFPPLFNFNNTTTNYNICYNNINNINNNNYVGINNKTYSSLNVEDLLILEEKLNEIIKALNNTKIIHNECFEFWNYYFNCSLYCKLEKLFTNIYESNEIRICINYLLMTILISYDYSFNINVINTSFQIFDSVLKLNRENLIFIYQYILTKISIDSRDNIWVFKLNDLVKSNININNININEYSKLNIVDKINNNIRMILQNLSFLLNTYKTDNNIYIINFLQNLPTKNYEHIDILFREKIFRVENINGSILASIYLKEHNKFKTEPAPYLKTINRKPYSLILDLDETLVHFKINPDCANEGVLRVRPGIVEFLDAVDKYYELIIFTAATQDYADLLIDAVEENKIYFEHRLYRQHTVIIGNDFVKDLSRVGRPLDKIIIVDNMPQNFRLQKENGINIKAFWGEEAYDTALVDLGNILVNIAKDGGDVRNGIKKYKDDIVKKVTSNISKH